jgi:hypothetical protein
MAARQTRAAAQPLSGWQATAARHLLSKWVVALACGAALQQACAQSQQPSLPGAQVKDVSGEQARELAMALINVLVEQGLISSDKAQGIVALARARVAAQAGAANDVATSATPAPAPSTHIQYVPEIVKQQLRDDVRKEVLAQARQEGWATPQAVPDWLGRFTLYGDLRLRYQAEQFGANNSTSIRNTMAINDAGTESIANATLYTDGAGGVSPRRDRLLVRGRLGVGIKASDDVDVGLRLSTGNTTDPVTTNQTMGNYGARYQVVMDRAWVHGQLGDALDLWGGRIDNPFVSTELVWAPDLGFDGVAGRYQWLVGQPHVPYLTVGAFPLQELASTRRDKWLFGAQLGSKWAAEATHARWGLAWWGYQNITGQLNETDLHSTDYTAPGYVQKGNTLYNIRVFSSSTDPGLARYALAGDYRLLDLNGAFDTTLGGGHALQVSADWVRNVGWRREQVYQRTGIDQASQNTGYLLKLSYGDLDLSHRGDWQVYGSYRCIGADAVLDAFTETDFHLGGTNAKGYVLGASYAVANKAVLSMRWLSADEITGPPLAIDLLQIDLNVKF